MTRAAEEMVAQFIRACENEPSGEHYRPHIGSAMVEAAKQSLASPVVTEWRHPLAISADDENYVSGVWKRTYSEMLLPQEFLTMLRGREGGFFQEDLRSVFGQWPVLERHFQPDELDHLLVEPAITAGGSSQLIVKMTTIHHLYGLALWEETTGADLRDVASVVEWGGGFGSFARLCLRRNPELEYVIVDLPVMSAIQGRYLAACDDDGLLDASRVAYCGPTESRTRRGDLFVATWSLDESPASAQQIVAGESWYGAERILMAYHPDKQDFEDSLGFADRLPPGVTTLAAPFTRGSFYAFR